MSGARTGPSLPATVPPKSGAIDPREAWGRIEGAIAALPAEEVPVAQAAGRRLADDAVAQLSLPTDTNSAMDGFAARAIDLPAKGAPIVGESRAGVPFDGPVPPGAVIRIATGAALPDGVDAVVPIELAEVDEAAGTVTLPAARAGAHIRWAGEDLRAGDCVVATGTRLQPHHLVALAASGLAHVRCYRQPVVSVIVTGDEVVPPGTVPQRGQVIDVHGTALPALIEASGGVIGEVRYAPDGRTELRDVLASLPPCDVAVITGGVSVGRHDHTRPALAEQGVRLLVERLLMRPGQPTVVGVTGAPQRLWFGLPGNPVSAYVIATLLLQPAIRRLGGDAAARIVPRAARLRDPVTPDPQRWLALRAELCEEDGGAEVVVLDGQASHMMADLARADRLALVAPGDAPLPAGSQVAVVMLPGLAR